jgi:hypothetical protein
VNLRIDSLKLEVLSPGKIALRASAEWMNQQYEKLDAINVENTIRKPFFDLHTQNRILANAAKGMTFRSIIKNNLQEPYPMSCHVRELKSLILKNRHKMRGGNLILAVHQDGDEYL